MDIVLSILGKEIKGISPITYETEEIVMNVTVVSTDNSVVNVDFYCSGEQMVGIIKTLSKSYSISVKAGSDDISLAPFLASMEE